MKIRIAVLLQVPSVVGFLETTNVLDHQAPACQASTRPWTCKMAYAGDFPSGPSMDPQGAPVLGVGGDKVEEAVLENIKAAGYGERPGLPAGSSRRRLHVWP